MATEAEKRAARERAQQLLSEFGVHSPPVPVERIAKSLGAQIQYSPFDGDLSGMAFIKDGIPIIGVNSLHHPNRQRFTLAHELAHILLHRSEIESTVHVDKGSLRRDALAAAGIDDKEITANAFAAELLMPQAFLAAALDGRTIDTEDDGAIKDLAKRFKVSEAAMRFRFET